MNTKSPTAAERAAKAEQRRIEGAEAMAEHHAREKAVDEKTARLRELRLARDANKTAAPRAEKKPTKKRSVDLSKYPTAKPNEPD